MRRFHLFVCLIFFLTSLLMSGDKDENLSITTGSLFEEMIDLTRLATFPEPPFRTVQFSSYDHRSQLPGGPDWFANSDGFGGEPIPNFEMVLKEPDEDGVGEYLVADVKGPGAIVRLWSARIAGRIQMYLDDSDEPVYDGEANDFFCRPYDFFSQIENIDGERFQNTVYQRDASYVPIPFARRLRVVWIGNLKDIHFYQLQVRLYPEGTLVKTFSPDDIAEYSETIDRVTLGLEDPDQHLMPRSKEQPVDFNLELKPSERKEALVLNGEGALERLVLQVQAENLDKALKQTVLHIICDDYPWGQVQSPLGDFFGASPGVNPYQSLPFTVKPDATMICRFAMPFAKSLKIQFDNLGQQIVTIKGSALPMPFAWNQGTMHFRARWRTSHNITGSNQEVQDIPFLVAVGKGMYVGTAAFILNPNPVPTPWGNWWGEGDEKVFVDEDVRPSLFGTGSEDYFNYSWSSPDIFYYPYCGQPRNDGPGNRGFVTNFRWHILDPIPFEKNIRFYLELFPHERTPGMSYARIGYHYARPGITDDHQPLMPEDVRYLQLQDIWHPEARFGAKNSVFFPAEDIITDKQNTRIQEGRLWAGGKLLVWTPEKEGVQKSFTIPVESKGKKRIYITAALTPKSGRITVLLDGKPVSLENGTKAIDLYRPHRTLLRNFFLKEMELEEGNHTLTLEYKGANVSVEKSEIGIDFIWIRTLER